MELNETGKKLLFRDKRSRLNLVDVENLTKTSVLNFCTFVQWVPGSGNLPVYFSSNFIYKPFEWIPDVVVAQSRENMAIWYNMDAPDRVTLLPIKGDVVDIVREDGKTEVIVQVVLAFSHNLFCYFHFTTETFF